MRLNTTVYLSTMCVSECVCVCVCVCVFWEQVVGEAVGKLNI